MLENARNTAFTVSELLKSNQQGVKLPLPLPPLPPPHRLGLKRVSPKYLPIFLFLSELCSCYRTVSRATWEIFSEFLIFCNLLCIRNEENICQYCTKELALTTLSLSAC